MGPVASDRFEFLRACHESPCAARVFTVTVSWTFLTFGSHLTMKPPRGQGPDLAETAYPLLSNTTYSGRANPTDHPAAHERTL